METAHLEDHHSNQRKKLTKNTESTEKLPFMSRSDWMDRERKNLQAYEYLCHVAEAKEYVCNLIKRWIENILAEELGDTANFEESLRNGIVLARVAKFFEPTVVKKIFEGVVLQFRHSDNIAYFISCLKKVGLPDIFYFELVDLYEKKNIPRVIYCIHAFSHLLAKSGRAKNINNLVGQINFSEDVIQRKQDQLDEAGIAMPAFSDVGSALEKHLTVEQKYMASLKGDVSSVVKIQSAVRMLLAKKRYLSQKQEKCKNDKSAVKIQAAVRGLLARKKITQLKNGIDISFVIQLQAVIRGFLIRRNNKIAKQHLLDNLQSIITMQSAIKGFLARKKYNAQMSFLKLHEREIIKIQSMYRGYLVRKAFNAITRKKETPLACLQMFCHLLEEDENDVEEDYELQELRSRIIKKIKDNNECDISLNELDIKIALLVKNSITLEEVIRHTKKEKEKKTTKFNKENIEKMKLFGNLYYLLQTQPHYVSKLLFLAGPNKIKSLTETVVFGLFGYGQNAREEYLILKLIESTMNEEIDTTEDVHGVMKENLIFIKLIVQFNRGAKEREYLRNLLGPLVTQILNEKECDLETDPLMIYRAMIKEEESQTGEKSTLPFDIPRDKSLEHPKVRETYIIHLKNVQSVVTQFMSAIISSLKKMPFGIRYIAKVFRKALKLKFPTESDVTITKAVGNLIYYRYINPAIVAPEAFDVLETIIPAKERKNLAEISKILQHISMNKPFGDDTTYLIPLNEFVMSAFSAFQKYFLEVSNVVDADEYFQIDVFEDLVQTQKPSIFISPADIYNTCSLVEKFSHDLTGGNPKDPLKILLNEIGPLPEGMADEKTEVTVTLDNRFAEEWIKDSDIKGLLLQTKKLVIPIVKIQKGTNLLDVIESPVSAKDEEQYAEMKSKVVHSSNPSTKAIPVQEYLGFESLSKLKEKIKENLAKLAEFKLVTRESKYQELLNMISKDIRSKRLQRAIRAKDIVTSRKTLANLESKSKYLKDQIGSYHDYLNASVEQLSKGKSKKRTILPFTKQYTHMKELQKQGKVPKFGSYKYSADALYKKGVLISIDDYSPKQYDKITLTISSDEPGIFIIEASLLGIKVPQKMELKLEDLLQSQFNNVQVFNLFGIAKVNVNLMIYLINKKFYQ